MSYIIVQAKEISLVDFVFNDFITCGINDMIMRIPPRYPINSIC